MDKEKTINAIGLELYEYLRTANHDEGEYKDLKPESKRTLLRMGELALQALCKELPEVIVGGDGGGGYYSHSNERERAKYYEQLKSWGKDD
jgi:hypothetical protein